MKIFQNLAIRNRLSSFFFGIAIVTIFVFANLMLEYFESGLEDSAKLRLLTESAAFAKAYEKDPTIPLPSTYVTRFAYDELPEVYVRGNNLLEYMDFSDGNFQIAMGDEELPDGRDEDPIIIAHRHTLHDGRILYTMAQYDIDAVEEQAEKWFSTRLRIVFYIGTGYLVLTILMLWYYNHKVGKRTSQLVDWAEEVSTNFTEKKPEFKFDEYNRIADCLQTSLRKNAELVEREKKFLAHASHELRTPIAIIRANMEILERIELPEMANVPVTRIERAGSNMQQITETLLWLARKSDNQPTESLACIPEIITQLIEEQDYLLQGESVEVIQEFKGSPERALPVTPVMIVVGNLIRNAFQYTHCGWVKISYEDNYITVENSETEQLGEEYEISFGFGLELTEKVCDKLGWNIDIQKREGGVLARLQLP
ncbi:histidine kinase dimerization/phospho-acceptor domain-containing protein [Vibrio sp. HN007]|uniref:histidine kinase dimerization/phospho-acceptor domain-containing protein n=1 Tax=Vibrio iocasae TaxID=3098914 RepID=UPI0035D45E82